MESTAPALTGDVDLLRNGPSTLAEEVAEVHPVEKLQQNKMTMWEGEVQRAAHVYGIGESMRMRTEQEIFARPLRLPHLPCSFLELESVVGSGLEGGSITFENILSAPHESVEASRYTPHELMEGMLKM